MIGLQASTSIRLHGQLWLSSKSSFHCLFLYSPDFYLTITNTFILILVSVRSSFPVKMDPGTATAVVSLALQIPPTIQSITEFLRTIKEVPDELTTLIETMDQMQANVNQVRGLMEQQFSEARLAGSPMLLLNALKACERNIKALGLLVEQVKDGLGAKNVKKRAWTNMSIQSKKARLRELESHLRAAMSNLDSAVLYTSWQLQ